MSSAAAASAFVLLAMFLVTSAQFNIDDAIMDSRALGDDDPDVEVKMMQASIECPSGFTFMPYVKGCYALVLDKLEMEVARIRCHALHPEAHLVMITDAHEQASIAAFLSWHNSMGTGAGSSYIWTAGQRVDPTRASTFIWRLASRDACSRNSVKEMTYASWGSGEPSNHGGIESCAALTPPSNYAWVDIVCWALLPAVCEFDLA